MVLSHVALSFAGLWWSVGAAWLGADSHAGQRQRRDRSRAGPDVLWESAQHAPSRREGGRRSAVVVARSVRTLVRVPLCRSA
ncbi:MAG: hypothetical protein LBE67_16430 [Kocuria palustris]|nr:hypothetical protein [Kocuria palustris]